MTFENKIKNLEKDIISKFIIFDNSVSKMTQLIQTKYPELRAEYSESDGGIIFINDNTMEEFYGIENVYEMLGKR